MASTIRAQQTNMRVHVFASIRTRHLNSKARTVLTLFLLAHVVFLFAHFSQRRTGKPFFERYTRNRLTLEEDRVLAHLLWTWIVTLLNVGGSA